MSRGGVRILVPAALIALCMTAPASEAGTLNGKCLARPLLDETAGAPVAGPEDLDFDAENGALLISAFDRLDESGAQGGIYRLSVGDLAGEGALMARNLTPGRPDFRPHGIALSDATLAVINHTHRREGAGPRGTMLDLFSWDGRVLTHRKTDAASSYCNANDIAGAPAGGWLFSRDRGACEGVDKILETVFNLGDGEVRHLSAAGDLGAFAEGLAFANGVAVNASDNRVFIAETQGRRIAVFGQAEEKTGRPAPKGPFGRERNFDIELAAGPDNLSIGLDGSLLAATLPAPFSLFLALNGWSGPVPSRLIRIRNPGSPDAAVEVLYENGGFSAATSIVETPRFFVAGSVIESALLVCPKKGT